MGTTALKEYFMGLQQGRYHLAQGQHAKVTGDRNPRYKSSPADNNYHVLPERSVPAALERLFMLHSKK